MTASLVGSLPLYCNSGKADPIAREEKAKWDDPVRDLESDRLDLNSLSSP